MTEHSTNLHNHFSDIIDIRRLERENRRYLWIGFLVAVVVHILAGIWLEHKLPLVATKPEQPEERTSIPVDIVVLPPRIRNPYEDWRRETPARTPRRPEPQFRIPSGTIPSRQMEPFEGYTDEYELDEDVLISGVFSIPIPESLYVRYDPPKFEIPRIYEDLTIEREPKRTFSLRDELLTIDDLDSLHVYRGFVIEDPENRRNLKGFLYIPKYIHEMRLNPVSGFGLTGVVNGLAEAFNLYTGVKITVDEPVSLASPYLHNYPLVYMTSVTRQAFRLNRFQAANFGDYLRNGGFAIIDNGRPWHDFYPAEASLLAMLVDSLGDDFRLEVLPYDHPVFHCFFDMEYPPPEGFENTMPPTESKTVGRDIVPVTNDWGDLLHIPRIISLQKKMHEAGSTVWGVWLGDRLVAVYSDKGYGHIWQKGVVRDKHRETPDGGLHTVIDNNTSAQMQFGVNLIVYALRRRDGKAVQYTDWNMSKR